MDHVVEARLHQLYKRKTGWSGVIDSSLEDASKLTFAHTVEETCLLLLLQLEQVFGATSTEPTTVLARRMWPSGQAALPLRRSGTFQSKLGPEPARDLVGRAPPAHEVFSLLDSMLNGRCLTSGPVENSRPPDKLGTDTPQAWAP
jgi:hypothetical protein